MQTAKRIYCFVLQIPVALSLIAFPFVYQNDLNFIIVPVCFFISCLIIITNFPYIIELLYAKPLYIEDLNPDSIHTEHTIKFRKTYYIAMNLCLSALFASISEYIIIQGINNKPVVEILAIVGGNIALFMKIQNFVGKFLLYICHCMKTREVRRLSDATPHNSPDMRPIDMEFTGEIELT